MHANRRADRFTKASGNHSIAAFTGMTVREKFAVSSKG
jgi:hypothetical protein